MNQQTVLDPIRETVIAPSPLNNYYAITDPPTSGSLLLGYTNGSEWINTLTDAAFKLVDEDNDTWIQITPTTIVPDTETVTVNFQYDTPSPLTLFTVKAGDIIVNCEITITESFDDNSATLAVGTVANPSLIMPTNFSKPSKAPISVFGTEENFPFTGNDTIILTITPGTSSQGEGYVVSQVKRS
jgi:hypothetical protein